VLTYQGVRPGDPVQALGQPTACQHQSAVIDDLDILMVLGPDVSHEQRRASSLSSDTGQQREGDSLAI